MRKLNWLAVGLCLVIGSLVPATVQGQQRPQVVGVGSSAQWPTIAIAAVTADPIKGGSAPCGTNFWTGTTGLANGVDARSVQLTTINPEPGKIWIAWDGTVTSSGSVTGLTTVCTFIQEDSVVGLRLFFGQGVVSSVQMNGWISLASGALTTPGSGQVSFMSDTAFPYCNSSGTWGAGTSNCGLPTTIYNIVNGANFNAAFTDIRPEDGVFALSRALCSPSDSQKFCLGYSEGLYAAGTYPAIQSVFSSSIANVVPFSIPPGGVPGSAAQGVSFLSNGISFTAGVDPIWTTPLTIPAATTYTLGAAPIMVIVNTQDTGSAGLGQASVTNVKSDVLSQIFSGWTGQTAALIGGTGGNGAYANPFASMNVIIREPTSGTYNTFEWQTVRSQFNQYGNSQELNTPVPSTSNANPSCGISQSAGHNPATQCDNPMDWNTGIDGGHSWKMRAIGTGDMVNNLNAGDSTLSDTIGYAFWSLGTFGKKTAIKYLTVDGIDPLYAGYSTTDGGNNGLFPTSSQCTGAFNLGTFSCSGYPLPTFTNIKNGNYKIWSIYRVVVDNSVQSYQTTTLSGTITPQILIQDAEDQAYSVSPDFVPFQICATSLCGSTTQVLQVFRSHYGASGVYPNNGILAAWYANNSITPVPEGGGDMKGSSFPWATELDYVNYAGQYGEFLGIIE